MSDLDYQDRQDFEDVERGFIATLSDPLVRNADGVVVWDAEAYDFIHGDAPATVSASLWRQGKLVAPARPVRGHPLRLDAARHPRAR